ncbi:hypothetical protein [Sporosarcina psychrophila]|uniref:Uncharacterized protein n=1 Tax=Sporosarcina psychrophila TaxID=1476 RepID=A0ABV2KEV9_SPOPS
MKRTWTTAERFTEDLMAEVRHKIENSKAVIELLDEKDIDFRFVCDDNAVYGILIDEDYFGDFAHLTLTFEGLNMKLTLERSNKKYETVETIVMEHKDARQVIATADALIMINKLGFNEALDSSDDDDDDEEIDVTPVIIIEPVIEEKPLTPAQKGAITRKRNKEQKERELAEIKSHMPPVPPITTGFGDDFPEF